MGLLKITQDAPSLKTFIFIFDYFLNYFKVHKFHILNLCKTAYKEKGEPDLVCGRYYKIAQFRHLKDGSSNALREL